MCYVLMYLNVVLWLVMINLIGLEDWKVKGVLFFIVDQWFVCEKQIIVECICVYE